MHNDCEGNSRVLQNYNSLTFHTRLIFVKLNVSWFIQKSFSQLDLLSIGMQFEKNPYFKSNFLTFIDLCRLQIVPKNSDMPKFLVFRGQLIKTW